MAENTTATKTFTYNLPNKMYDSSDSDGLTASATYVCFDRVYVFVDSDGDHVGKRNRALTELTAADDGAIVPEPDGTTRVEVTLEDDPLILALFRVQGSTITTNNQTTVTETYGDYTVSYNNKPEVQETYVDEDSLVYNLETEAWNTPAYKSSPSTWAMVIESRDAMLEGSDGKISPDMPTAVKDPWIAYRAALRALPTVYKKGESDEVESWKVQYPLSPDTKAE